MYIKNKKLKGGFTLIEIMIAMTLFTAIMIIGTGAVLQTNSVHKKTQTIRSVTDNLNFIMEDMARNLRLGGNYHCLTGGDPYQQPTPQVPQNCVNGGSAISFIPSTGGTNNTVVYRLQPPNYTSIEKSKDGGASFTTLTPLEVQIDPAKSGFTVIGSTLDAVQPRVIIRLSGTATYKTGLTSTFNLETTVSQRLLDI